MTLFLKNYRILFFVAIAFATALLSFNAFTDKPNITVYDLQSNNIDWLKPKDGIRLSNHDVTVIYKEQLGMGSQDRLIFMRMDEDQMGNAHSRYQHYHNNIKVEGSQLLVHSKDEEVYLVNGTLVRNLDLPRNLNIDRDEAFAIAFAEVPAETYIWESETAEKLIKKIKKDASATNYPSSKLVYVHPTYSRDKKNYQLAYDITVHALTPDIKERIFVNAETGEIVLKINELHTGSSHGIAETRYHGTQSIITDSIAVDSFRLVDTIRGPGIITMNANRTTNLDNATDFYDDDNYWNNVNAQQNEVAGDIHFGAEQTFDFYGTLGQYGLNGDSLPFLSFVHYDVNWTNASWNGMFARFGDSQSPNTPLAALDVVAHEFTHGLTDFTADLVYRDEPGGLNESFSDIFGTAVEFYADSASGDYRIGEDFIAGGGFRNMADPKSFGDPHTYRGANWINDTGNSSGVHTNSGVQNFWFYLLSEGGVGQNDNGDTYEVDSIGIQESIKIAYGNLKNYLLVNSQYIDARMGAIQAAIDIYGACSNEVVQTTNAWYAVGVGEIFPRGDIELLQIMSPDLITCGLNNAEQITVLARINDCGDSLSAGTVVPFYYVIDQMDTVYQDHVIAETVYDGDSLSVTFNQVVEAFAEVGNYTLEVAVNYEFDNSTHNNSIVRDYERIYDQNFDLQLDQIISPSSGCYLSTQEVASFQVSFHGCDSIAAGEDIEIRFRIDEGDWTSEFLELSKVLYRNDTIKIDFDQEFNFSENNEYFVDAEIIYLEDTLNQNNSVNDILIDNPHPLQYDVMMTFEAEESIAGDSLFTRLRSQSQVFIADSVGFKNTRGLCLTGQDGAQAMFDDDIERPRFEEAFVENMDYVSQVCFCADLTNVASAKLRFRINQTYSPIYEDLFQDQLNYASAARLMLNGEQEGSIYTPNMNENNPYFLRNLDVSSYIGGALEICFEAQTFTSKENDPYGIGDNVHIDEVILTAEAIVNTEDVVVENIRITPNPANSLIFLQDLDMTQTRMNVEIYNVHGQLIRSINNLDVESATIDIQDLAQGLYFLKFSDYNTVFTGKFVKQ